MNWKSNTGSKVKESNIENISPSKKINFITTPMNPEADQAISPHKTIYVTVEFLRPEYEITSINLERLEESGGAFDFLNDKEEKSYKQTDGDPI